MKKATKAVVEKRVMYDIMLLQQAALFKLKDRSDRHKSRDTLQALFFNLQSTMRPGVTMEIGAMDAAFSRRMASLGIPAYAFEANSYNFAKFGPEIAALNLPLHYLHMAICDLDGTVEFQVQKSVDGAERSPIQGNNSLMQRNRDLGDVEYETLSVPAARLETFLAENNLKEQSFSVWIDVEGALSKVLAGFGTGLKHCQSILVELEEVSYWDGQMLYSEAMDYFIGQGFVPVARDFESRHQFNVLFLAEDKVADPKVRIALTRYFVALASGE